VKHRQFLRAGRLPVALTAAAATIGALLMSGGAAHAATTTPAPAGHGAAAKAAQATVAGLRGKAAGKALATDEANFGDLDGDAKADLAAIDSTGKLWVYPGKATVYPGVGPRPTSFFSARFAAGTGWGAFTALVRHGDWNGDGKQDILARDAKGKLFLYAGTGNRAGIVKKGVQVGTGWNTYSSLVGVGDINSDGNDDLIGRRDGHLVAYFGTGNGAAPFRSSTFSGGTGWNGDLLTTVGDWTADGRTEYLFRNTSKEILVYEGSPDGFPANGPTRLFEAADGAAVTSLVGMGNLTSDAVIDGKPVIPTPDALVRFNDGTLFDLAIDTADDFNPFVGGGWNGYTLF
jgi:FG-GAP-like repeat